MTPTNPTTTIDHAAIARQVAELEFLTVNELQRKWEDVWREPCRSRNKIYLRKRVAWKIQANVYGGISQRALERARELADETLLKIRNPAPFRPMISVPRIVATGPGAEGNAASSASCPAGIPAPGSIIVRNYKGRKLLVTVLEKGFEFEGIRYRSLSAVAKAVTGTNWNGRLFFGIDNKEAA
ncbi:DUF2924 domain-containing protein [Verrucomicrobia bacterium LW23]|nr:DUF2924 domain-containing protein [Verrucomicrobia bacterium LW23]